MKSCSKVGGGGAPCTTYCTLPYLNSSIIALCLINRNWDVVQPVANKSNGKCSTQESTDGSKEFVRQNHLLKLDLTARADTWYPGTPGCGPWRRRCTASPASPPPSCPPRSRPSARWPGPHPGPVTCARHDQLENSWNKFQDLVFCPICRANLTYAVVFDEDSDSYIYQ